MPAVTQATGSSAANTAKANKDNNNISKNQPQDTEHLCSNPFRIPHHAKRSGLRNVPQLVRERLAHVHFGMKICNSCRHRVYDMLKERKQLNASERLKNNNGSLDRRRSELPKPQSRPQQQNRRSEPPVVNVARVKQVTMTVTASSEAEKRAIESLFTQDDSQDAAGLSSGASNAASNLEVESSALLEHAMSRRNRPQVQELQSNLIQPEVTGPVMQICCFCGLTEDNELEYGKFYHHRGIVTHYYCLLLSSNMEQKGNDDEGILGFLEDDIRKEIKRGKRLVCSHCKRSGATLGCCNIKCKRIFHFPCGLKAGSLHQFFGEFRSYCINHRPKQKIDERLIKEIQSMQNILCYICYEDVEPLDSNCTLWAPCCKKNAWFHRKCVQQLAMSAGYFFKCPLCNNKREFQTAMLEYGIYIPRQDASWELVPNAFEELLYRHDCCDTAACLCPKGRTYTSNNTKWKLILCRMCGSQGTHIFCSGLKWLNPVWECQECISILNKPISTVSTDDSTSNSNEISTQRETTLNVTMRECDEDSDSDISVGNESIPLETSLVNIPTIIPHIKLRPGPRSFKLQQIQKLQNSEVYKDFLNQTNSLKNSNTTENNGLGNSRLSAIPPKITNDIICIDSDEETVEIVCENVMRKAKRNRRLCRKSNLISTSSSNSSSLSNQINCAYRTNMNALPEETHDSPFNIIISNVTSVPPEFFASAPELLEEKAAHQVTCNSAVKDLVAPPSTGVKRSHPSDEEVDVLHVARVLKRPRLESNVTTNHCLVSSVLNKQVTSAVQTGENSNSKISEQDLIEPVPLSNIKKSPSKIETEALALIRSSSGASSSQESCHGDAGTRLAKLNIDDRLHTGETAAIAVVDDELPDSQTVDTESAVNESKLSIRHVLENGSSSHCSSSGVSGGSFKSRYSSGDRSGLIPDYVRLSDLKFKICGNDVELSYRSCRIQVKMNSMQSSNSTTLNDLSNAATASVSPFAGSNQHLSGEKSSKSFQLRSDDSTDESDRISRSLRTRSLRNFVYEDDNTLLEYPTPVRDSFNNTKKTSHIITDKRFNRSDLKENWDPEVSSSSNNDFDSSIIGKTKQLGSMDLREAGAHRERSSKIEEHSFSQFQQKEDLNNEQRPLRRSNRIVRHFQSVQESKLNGQISENLIDSNVENVPSSLSKSNQISTCKQFIKSSRSLKVLSNSADLIEQQDSKKHLRNVDIDELKLTLTNKITSAINKNHLHTNMDLKVSIDLQKISSLISAKPDLFFKTKNNKSGRRQRDCSIKEKLKVESKPGVDKLLTKSRSYECLLGIVNDGFSYFTGRSKSYECLSSIDKNNLMPLTDIKDCIEMKTISQQQKRRQFEKHECVR